MSAKENKPIPERSISPDVQSTLSEISSEAEVAVKRHIVGQRTNLLTQPLSSDGLVKQENGKTSYIANDFIEKLTPGSNHGLSMAKASITPKYHNVVNPSVLDDLENDCYKLSKSVDEVLAELTKRLNQITAISVANTQACNDVVNNLGTRVDNAVHSMYALIAHCEELDKAMLPVYKLATKIERIKDVVSALEANVH
ncbi:unnamed protein product [Clavelina lepadiformis]|uniref:BLOC-1-related complex subunit 6 C-terminal helix domain-containing protein n=1 Tax=Clavelina lepadiformis TaxID=159417 RepID=A0ABP0G9U3_CLALP